MENVLAYHERKGEVGALFPLGLGDQGMPSIQLLQLLCGTLIVENLKTQQRTKTGTNFLDPGSPVRRRGKSKVLGYISSDFERPNAEALQTLRQTLNLNRDFYAKLNPNIGFLVIAMDQKRYLEAFLLMYRTLESISLAIPLIYTSNLKNYKKAHDFIENFAKKNGGGELKIFERFIDSIISGDDPLSKLNFKFVFDSTEIFERQMLSEIIRILNEENIEVEIDDVSSTITVSFKKMHALLIGVRNRLFHDMASKDNIRLEMTGGVEVLCAKLVHPLMNWLAILLSQIVTWEVERG